MKITNKSAASASRGDGREKGPKNKRGLTTLLPEDSNSGAGRTGTLYICGTPIGNLEDITLRLKRVLEEVDLIAAEDTRRTGQLLHHLEIRKPTISYHQHNEVGRAEMILNTLAKGESVALVSDAGMPVISDPGHVLISQAIEKGFSVVPIPGPTAATTALVAAGISAERFTFEGFLPRSGAKRRHLLQALTKESRTMVFYEAPHRLGKTVVDLADALGAERPATVARELTKVHEEFVRATLGELVERYKGENVRGECVLVVAGASTEVADEADTPPVSTMLEEALQRGLSLRDAARVVAEKTGMSRRKVYQLGLAMRDDGANDT